ncbi:chondroitin sulfate proteoglycan 5 isoform X2 [Eucyclogobius newberryi]|uniref:chondroitin sulfate proteoglycan 5 isoform X2 n=1 Tax=Eucyclogobius newberryi TaxID=166745 RepID=UPI003B5C06C4
MESGGRLALLVCVLAMHLMPLAVHGNEILSNGTEPEISANLTSLLPEEAEPAKAAESIVAVTGVSASAGPNTVSTASPRVGRLPRAGEQDVQTEQGSGMFPEPVVPTSEEQAVPPQISPDSAETEHLLPSNAQGQEVMEGEEQEEEEELHTAPPWIHNKDTAVFNLDSFMDTMPPPSTNLPNQDVLHVDFFDPSSRGRGLDLAPPPTSNQAHELQGGDPTSWAMPDNYDYLSPYDEGVSPTAEDYYMTTTDAYESDVDLRLSRTRSRLPGPSSFLPGVGRVGLSGPVAAPPAALPVDGSDGKGGCRVGYQRVNGSCRSPCDLQQNYCLNGGQCYLLEGMGVFCRCNIQDYMWNKGARCESVVTEFQVMCLAVGASAVVLLLLFMIVVCFAKKLHLLKTENKKLRRRSKYRPSSEQHNDNFSLSTIAEGSHPNVRKLCDTPPNVPHARALAYYDNIICQDDPHSQNKLEDPVKAPPKEDESLNIHNSLTPKPDHHKVLGEENSEVNSMQNNMM